MREGSVAAQYQEKAEAMKKAVLSSPDLAPSSISGTCYYVSENGNDENDGLSPETAIRSMARIGSLPLRAGDGVFFHRGGLYRGILNCVTGVTYAAWGSGPKPVLCGSKRNFAEPSLWKPGEIPGIWVCTQPIKNAGIMTIDLDPETVGEYHAKMGCLVPREPEMEPAPYHLKNDLEFWCDLEKCVLHMKSAENPGKRFRRIEIGEHEDIFCLRFTDDVTADNLRFTVVGGRGISASTTKNLVVTNCIFDYIGGSILWTTGGSTITSKKNVRFGNAVEIFGGCRGYHVRNNWIYQIYDTGITHQYHRAKEVENYQEDVEYHDNLIEYCFWSIEYYNFNCKYTVTRNVYVHDNFCRFGGEGWGCPGREKITPMYSFMGCADVTENYRTENNIFQFSKGFILVHFGELEPPGTLFFRGNTYIQQKEYPFAKWGDRIVSCGEADSFLKETLGEKDFELIVV